MLGTVLLMNEAAPSRRTKAPLSETLWKSGSASILSEEAPGAATDSSRKSAEATEDGSRPDATEVVPHWWRETCTKEPYDQGEALCYVGATVVLRIELARSPCGALLDTGASRSFISPKTVERLELKVRRLPEEYRFTVATGAQLRIDRVVTGLTIRRYKSHAKTKAKARITSLVRQAADDTNDLRTPLHGLHLILALPEACSAVPLRLSDEWQGALCCALIGSQPTSSGCRNPLASTASVAAESDEESPWPMAKLEHTLFDEWINSTEAQHTLFDEWINSTEAQDIPCEVAQVLHEYRAVFPDTLPKGLPPKRPHDHHIILAPGKLPERSAIYRITPDQLTFHKQEITKLSDSGWIGPTYSPMCSPTIMVDKRDDGSGERKMRMVVNHQALNALTIAPDFPPPPIQTILELLGGAKYFSTLDLEADSIKYVWLRKTGGRRLSGPFSDYSSTA
ncbi:hypothetical protein ETH_00010515 [Eimeria tenella]|uniref:Uncharacterized protein n=1 Tax=Eimeria tenella TaxID=5802 RepID=U6L1N5_EIMTE|nr:hypothetical protein ETH_00010515 [Eimeria tenella]CDJ41680.1 hypothetical protein ETH_00010515 [Eimeria tenella]|eukprot:XP_013232430.1 hypothetical protein ETH_00010515 [Eimeria tenella]